ncbi:MAG: NAD(P)-binding domain-containing protein [Deltaproteobacteria bacterium]|nr:NAD(P)-binding domain-containing protein [Deltaproteobacteria bacterium]
MSIYDVIIAGGGPAGVGAAIQLRHNGFKPLLIEKERIGGRIVLARSLENLISFKPIKGNKVCKILEEMLKRKKIEIRIEEVLRIEESGHIYVVATQYNKYFSRYVIVATGLKPVIPEIDGIDNSMAKEYVFYEWKKLKRDLHSPVLVIGAGEVGADSACSLKEKGFDVILFSRSVSLAINPVLKEDIKRLKIRIINCVEYQKITYDKDYVRLHYKRGGKTFIRRGKAILVTAGGRPNIPPVSNDISKGRIFFCGDVKSSNYHQAAVAFGDGVNTAMYISSLLKGGNNVRGSIKNLD